jgi:hypothetical protein
MSSISDRIIAIGKSKAIICVLSSFHTRSIINKRKIGTYRQNWFQFFKIILNFIRLIYNIFCLSNIGTNDDRIAPLKTRNWNVKVFFIMWTANNFGVDLTVVIDRYSPLICLIFMQSPYNAITILAVVWVSKFLRIPKRRLVFQILCQTYFHVNTNVVWCALSFQDSA